MTSSAIDVRNYLAALRDVRDLDGNTSIEEFQDARGGRDRAYDEMIEASAGEVGVRLDDLQGRQRRAQ